MSRRGDEAGEGTGPSGWRSPGRRAWLLLPHGLACLGFLAAYGVMRALETNRSQPDLVLGVIGGGSAVLALLASLLALALHPWRSAGRADWLVLALHLPALAAVLLLFSTWFALHLA